MVAAAPVWASSQNTQGQAKIWLEYKGPQVLDACDPGMPSTYSAVNVETWGGFFEPGIDSGLKQARVQFSPHDVLEFASESPDNWVAIPSNGQLRLSLQKGDNIIYFRQKGSSYAPMPSSERRTVRINLLTSCSDCRGAPGGGAISSQRGVFGSHVQSSPYDVKEGTACRDSNHVRIQPHYRNTDCRIRSRREVSDAFPRGYEWVDCNPFSNEGTSCGSVPGSFGSWACTREAWYTCTHL